LKTIEFLKVLVTKSTSHQLIWLKILADGESVPLSILAKIGGVSKTQAHNIVSWGKELQDGNSPKISQKPTKTKSTRLVKTSKNEDEDKNLISQKVEEIISYLNQVAGKKFSPTTEDNAKPIRKRLEEKYKTKIPNAQALAGYNLWDLQPVKETTTDVEPTEEYRSYLIASRSKNLINSAAHKE
jgi:hypothetical protein